MATHGQNYKDRYFLRYYTVQFIWETLRMTGPKRRDRMNLVITEYWYLLYTSRPVHLVFIETQVFVTSQVDPLA